MTAARQRAPSDPEVSVPFSEHPWINGLPSPYYTDSHRRWQRACRDFMHANLTSLALEWERDEQVPESVFGTFAKANMLVPMLPAPLPVRWLRELGLGELPGGLPVEEFDYLHTAIYMSEMSRSGLAGPPGSLSAGMTYGIPPIIKFGSETLQRRFLPDALRARTRFCIAITEPDAGSDVANVTTTAVKSRVGRHYIVNGAKKWITNGIWSDYATMAVRTGGKGAAGLSLLVVPLKGQAGVSMRRIKVQGQFTAGTTYIELDDVQVPVENLIGDEGRGMSYIMTNFNHERLTIAVGVTTQARVVLAAAFAYVLKREAFGQPLISQPVVRHRLAKAGAEVEALWSWVESFCYQMAHLPKQQADVQLGGLTALAKAKAGMVLNECAQTAVLLFGGNGFTRTGQGELAERVYREVMGARIPGGSEDVLLDLSVRQLVKNYARATAAVEQQAAASGGSSKL